jgi:hypothetical protein
MEWVEDQLECHTVYMTDDALSCAALNPLDHYYMSLVTTKGIMEIDLVNSMKKKAPGSYKEDFLGKSPLSGPKYSLSFESLQRSLQHRNKMKRLVSLAYEQDSGEKLFRPLSALSVEPHPSFNYYLAGFEDLETKEGMIHLYQYGQERDLITYSAGNGRISQCRFDTYGTNFAGCDVKGSLKLWKFDSSPSSIQPWISLPTSLCYDACFLDSSSLVASGGLSMSFK